MILSRDSDNPGFRAAVRVYDVERRSLHSDCACDTLSLLGDALPTEGCPKIICLYSDARHGATRASSVILGAPSSEKITDLTGKAAPVSAGAAN